MKLNDAIFGVLLLLGAIAVLVTSYSFPDIPGQKIGPGAFPSVVAAILAVCSVLLIMRGVRSGQRAVAFGPWLRSPRYILRFLTVIGVLLFYVVASPYLGFIITGVLLMVALLRAFSVRWSLALITAFASSVVIHSIFYKILRVPLPWGLLEGVAW